jgi:hypothetical protein
MAARHGLFHSAVVLYYAYLKHMAALSVPGGVKG